MESAQSFRGFQSPKKGRKVAICREVSTNFALKKVLFYLYQIVTFGHSMVNSMSKLGKLSNQETIQKCFANAGFGFYEQTNLDHEEHSVQNMIDYSSSSNGIECCSGNNYMNIAEEEELVHKYMMMNEKHS